MGAMDTIEDVLDGPTVVWLGAGMSAEHGYPTWPRFIADLCEACGVAPPADDTGPTDWMELADQCKTNDVEAYSSHIIDVFGEQALTPLARNLHYDLLRLRQFAYVTTNFDFLLVDAAGRIDWSMEKMVYPHLQPHLPFSSRDTVFLCYVHGLAEPNEDGYPQVVLTRTEFEEAYAPGGPTRRMIETLLHGASVLFIGVGDGLTDPYLRQLLLESKVSFDRTREAGEETPRRVALLVRPVGLQGQRQAEADRAFHSLADDLQQLGVEAVGVDATASPVSDLDGGPHQLNYRELDRILSEVAKRRGLVRQVPTVRGPGLRPAPERGDA